MATQVIMPQLGESVVEGTVSVWLKQVGEYVAEYEPIVEVSTDKVTSEIPSPASGYLLEILVHEDETVSAGTILCMIGEQNEVPEKPKRSNGHTTHHSTPSGGVKIERVERSQTRLSPVVARMVSEHQLDVNQIQGTGLGGRVTRKDVEAFLSSGTNLPPWEQPGSGDLFKPTDAPPIPVTPSPTPQLPVTPSPTPQRLIPVESIPEGAGGELVKLTAMRKSIAQHMVDSQLHIAPHVTTVFEVDLTNVLKHLEIHKPQYAKQGVNLTLTAYFVQAMVVACQASPMLNSQWTDEGIYLHHHVHVGMAVAIDEGLIVPVIRHAEELNLVGTARRVNDLATRARAKQLKPDEIQGSTITITNHGVAGSILATPIINQPNSAIFGVGMMEKRVKVINDAIAIRPCAYISLTFDHRVGDGSTGDAWMVALKKYLETIE